MKIIISAMVFVMTLFAQPLEKLIIAGPVATISHPIFKMIQSGALKDVAKEVEFRLWKNPDELRAILLKKRHTLWQFLRMLLRFCTIKVKI